MDFLEKVVKDIVANYGEGISDLCIVLPNRRAGLFFKKHLSKYINKPIWLPQILGAEELIEKLSNSQMIDNTHQLFELYNTYSKITPQPESFDEFSQWGTMLLHDFNEIDRYLIDPEKIYNHVNEAHAIDVWNVGGEEITEFQQKYINFWKQMKELYFAFQEHLEEKNQSYQGAAFRKVAQTLKNNPEQFIEEKVKWNKVIFVGFNALTTAEETVITTLKKWNRAEVYWDADKYYLEDKNQESGMFLQRFVKKEHFKPFNFISNKFKEEKKDINIIGIPQNVGQAKYLKTILSQISSENNFQDTAIVLADENLLIPVLQSIPSEIENINVTMGYPLKHTPLNNFITHFIKTIINAERFGSVKKLTYNYKDLLIFIESFYAKRVFGEKACDKIKDLIVSKNWVFINQEKLETINDELTIALRVNYSVNDVLDDLIQFIERIKSGNDGEKINSLEMEYLFMFAKLFKQLKDLLSKYSFIETTKALFGIYKQILSSYNLDLYGEPLAGLQVMGVLETRNIDFKNVIILSTNEGILPSGKTFNSFIPFDIKKAYQLPTHTEKDAIYAYHFYRLLQNADSSYILYNTETSEFSTGEQSRFITQIENELRTEEFRNNISITKKIVSYPTIEANRKEKEVFKDEKILQRLHDLFIAGISPTALITYITCPLDFYYKYVIGAREDDEVEESISASTFGTVIHDTLECLYKEFESSGKVLVAQDIKQFKKKANAVLLEQFLKKMSEKELKSGRNFITYSISKEVVQKFLNQERQFIEQGNEILIKGLEKTMQCTLTVGEQTVLLKGKADRVDFFGNTLRIIDYKTGKVVKRDLKVSDMTDMVSNPDKSKAFQLLMYAYLFAKENSIDNFELKSGIISFRVLSEKFMPFVFGKNDVINTQTLEEFEHLLRDLIQEIKNPDIPFAHKREAKYCKYCS